MGGKVLQSLFYEFKGRFLGKMNIRKSMAARMGLSFSKMPRRYSVLRIICLLMLGALLCGCGRQVPEPTLLTVPEPPSTAPETTLAETVPEDPDYYINYVYPEQLREFYTGLTRGWSPEEYADHGRSPLPEDFRRGDPLGNVGFLLEDLDGNGLRELVIGAIRGAEEAPLIFEVWTLRKDEPELVLRAEEGERYFLLEGSTCVIAKETEEGVRRRAFLRGELSDRDVEPAPASYWVPRYYPFFLYAP